jgi:hypothetical protein
MSGTTQSGIGRSLASIPSLQVTNWHHKNSSLFVSYCDINPALADEQTSDPTIFVMQNPNNSFRRCRPCRRSPTTWNRGCSIGLQMLLLLLLLQLSDTNARDATPSSTWTPKQQQQQTTHSQGRPIPRRSCT